MDDVTRERVDEALRSSNWEEHEKLALKWVWRLDGDFRSALWQVITLANEEDLARLALVFPVDVRGWLAYRSGGLADRFMEQGLLI